MYSRAGVYLTRASKGSRVIGWQRVRSFLAESAACPYHRSLGQVSCPMLHMWPQLENTYRTLSDLPHATKGDPEDADSASEDHLPDALRYLLINLGGGAAEWIDWARKKAEAVRAAQDGSQPPADEPPAPPEPEPEPVASPLAAARLAAFRDGRYAVIS
jgi:hypothetical protein